MYQKAKEMFTIQGNNFMCVIDEYTVGKHKSLNDLRQFLWKRITIINDIPHVIEAQIKVQIY